MKRGVFKDIATNPFYKESTKDWYIELLRSERVWYDLLINPVEELDTKGTITKMLKELKHQIKEQNDKGFIYYIATRPRVRFSLKKKFKYSSFEKNLIIYIEIGKTNRIEKIKIPSNKISLYDENLNTITPTAVLVDERHITFCYGDGRKVTWFIHDFLFKHNISIGCNTEIHYVGYTDAPWQRPSNGLHRGLAETLYNTCTKECDIFFYYNIFKVMSITKSSQHGISFNIANSVIDEIGVKKEGGIIEKALIMYFDGKSQEINKTSERGQLLKVLKELSEEYKIASVGFGLEIEPPSEYFRFYSRAVEACVRHEFTLHLIDGEPQIEKGKSIYTETLAKRREQKTEQ